MKLPRMGSVLDDLLAVLSPQVAIKIRRERMFDPCMLVLPAAIIYIPDQTQREHGYFLYRPSGPCVFLEARALRMLM